MTAGLDESIDVVLTAVDEARDVATTAHATPARPSGDDDVAALLATVRLEMSMARARRDVELAEDLDDVVAATDAVAAAARRWLDDCVIQGRLARMQPRDRAEILTRRVRAAADEMRLVSDRLQDAAADGSRSDGVSGGVDLERARQVALRTVRLAGASFEDAVMSVRHSS